jgi:hypothetical protein
VTAMVADPGEQDRLDDHDSNGRGTRRIRPLRRIAGWTVDEMNRLRPRGRVVSLR